MYAKIKNNQIDFTDKPIAFFAIFFLCIIEESIAEVSAFFSKKKVLLATSEHHVLEAKCRDSGSLN